MKNHTVSTVGRGSLAMREKLSYGAGEIASNVAWNMVTGFLLVYYSDVALLPVAALGTLMLVTRILDALFDPMVGILVDRTHSRHGKARPYLLYAPLPFALLCVATFTVPDLSAGWKLFYAYATFTALGLLYSLVYIPYSAMLPMMTRDPADKVQLGSFRAMGTSIASIFAYGLTMPIVGWAGGADRQQGFTIAAIVMASVTALLYYVVFFNCRERIAAQDRTSAVPVGLSVRQMAANPLWRLLFTLMLLIFVKIGILVTSVAYLTKDVLGKPWLVSVMLPLLSVAILAGGFISGLYFRKVSKRVGNQLAIAVSIVLTLALPFLQHDQALFIGVFVLSQVIGGIQAATTFIMLADAVEVHEAKFGNRAEGLLASSVSFGIKVGMAIGTAVTAYALGWAGYTPGVVSQAVVTAIDWLFYGAPVIVLLLQALCFHFYRDELHVVPAGMPNVAASRS